VGRVVNVVEKEFSITMPKAAMVPGTYTFQVSNQGTISHNLHNLTVSGPGVATKGSSTISPGQSADLTVTLQRGSYQFWCSVDSHKDRGMDLTVKVGRDPVPTSQTMLGIGACRRARMPTGAGVGWSRSR
jgi:uncharacterized cupredoxin-like copper-binding protein